MSEPITKPVQTPESYKPQTPKLTDMLENLSSEKVIDTIMVEGVEFTIIEKPRTFYAGVYGEIDDLNWRPNTYSWGALDAGFDSDILKTIRDSVTPDCEITLYIDYAADERPFGMLCGQETKSRQQPNGITVIEAEPSLYIRVNHNHEAFALTKKLTGKYLHQYHMLDLHELIKHLFCDGEGCVYEPNGSKQNGNEDMQIEYSNEEQRYAAVPVKIKNGCEKVPVKLNINYPYSTKSPFKSGIDFTKTIADIDASQEPPKEFEKMKFGGRDWLVLDKQDGSVLLLSENATEYRRYHHTDTDITWAECELRGYLNNDFYNSFSDTEKERIIKTKVTTPVQPWHGTSGGADTDDYIFLLSVQEVVKYFGDSGDMEHRKGWWADMEGYWLGNGFGQVLYDQYNLSRSVNDANGADSIWWLRSPGRLNKFAIGVGPHGCIGFTGHGVYGTNKSVRPAMWVKI
ncbi:MAG: DUF6273 domain-containing protein [Clostridiales bacterium]|jgi:hypothetical protein|nr:DUF6273 domain-containing protein [Clostridiales bacterium]